MSDQMTKLQVAYFGAIGAIAPDVVLLYSKRWTDPLISFEPWQYLTVTAFYLLVAGVAATIFPYGKHVTPWKAFAVGVALPVIVSGLASIPSGITPVTTPPTRGGVPVPGTLYDLFALF